eukprot:COSAG02_NODE_8674_length_2484_cov_11.800232_2_plen_110_part_00
MNRVRPLSILRRGEIFHLNSGGRNHFDVVWSNASATVVVSAKFAFLSSTLASLDCHPNHLAPQNAVVTCEGKAGMERLQNWDKNYEAACTKNGNRPPPQHVTYDMLVDA